MFVFIENRVLSQGPTLKRARDVEVTIITKRPSGTKRFSATAAFLGWWSSDGHQLVITSSIPRQQATCPRTPRLNEWSDVWKPLRAAAASTRLAKSWPAWPMPKLHQIASFPVHNSWVLVESCTTCSCHSLWQMHPNHYISLSHCPNMNHEVCHSGYSVPSSSVQVAGTGVWAIQDLHDGPSCRLHRAVHLWFWRLFHCFWWPLQHQDWQTVANAHRKYSQMQKTWQEINMHPMWVKKSRKQVWKVWGNARNVQNSK